MGTALSDTGRHLKKEGKMFDIDRKRAALFADEITRNNAAVSMISLAAEDIIRATVVFFGTPYTQVFSEIQRKATEIIMLVQEVQK